MVEEIYNGTDIVGGGQVLRKCAAHSSVDDADLYGVLYSNPDGENKRKNQIHRILLGLESVKGLGLEEQKLNPDGSSAGVGLKNGIEYKWSFQGTGRNRTMRVEVRGAPLSILQKTSIASACDAVFGAGKIEIL